MMSVFTWSLVLLAGLSGVLAVGTQIPINDVPSLVQVDHRIGAMWLQQCLGTLLTSFHVVSAASCFDAPPHILPLIRHIRAGASQRFEGGQLAEIHSAIIHPSYYQGGNEGDIAVVRTQAPFIFGPSVQQGQILGQGIDLPIFLPVQQAGWGTTNEGGVGAGDSNLYSANFFVQDRDVCLGIYFIEGYTITENHICTGLTPGGGRDFDSRDAGGPVYYQGVLVGIKSHGRARSGDAIPIVATAVSSYTNWIIEVAV